MSQKVLIRSLIGSFSTLIDGVKGSRIQNMEEFIQKILEKFRLIHT